MYCSSSDDEALGVGGTLIKHSALWKCFLVILSLGEESKKKKSDKNLNA